MSSSNKDSYYLPSESIFPFWGSLTLFIIAFGAANFLNENQIVSGSTVLGLGFLSLFCLFFLWFRTVIYESPEYNLYVDRSFRMSMGWFIFSEVMFFAGFFGALYYVRQLAVPWLAETDLLWPGFEGGWPTAGPTGEQHIGADTAITADGQFAHIGPWGLPLLNTALLLTSSITCTIAHHAIVAGQRTKFNFWLGCTWILGAIFLFYQAEEYIHAYHELGLTLGTGVYGSTFFLLTGFHGFHVAMGTLILFIIWLRSVIKGHFSPERHFGFEAAAWYWHFVDVVWVGLFIFVYIL